MHITKNAKKRDIDGLLNNKGEYQAEEENNRTRKFCENNVVNSISSVYEKKARENHIDMGVDIILSNKIHIKKADMVSILANILENVMNSCLKSEVDKKVITLKVYKKSNKVVIICKNQVVKIYLLKERFFNQKMVES